MKLNLVEQWFKPSNILDIGANIGLWQTEAKKAWPDAYIYSIEANTDCEPWLQNLGCDYKICLLTKDENNYNYHKKIYGGAENAVHGSGNSIYKEKTLHFVDGEYETESIKGTTLDSLFEDTSFDLIKIDTQGTELQVLKSSSQTIKKDKPVIIFEFESEYFPEKKEHEYYKNEILNFFKHEDYNLYMIDPKLNYFPELKLDYYFRGEILALPKLYIK